MASDYSSSYDSGSSGEETGTDSDSPTGSKIDLSYHDLDSDMLEANLQYSVDTEER